MRAVARKKQEKHDKVSDVKSITSYNSLYRIEKNLKEILSSPKLKKNKSSTSNCHKSLGIISYVIIKGRVRLVVERTRLVVTCLVTTLMLLKLFLLKILETSVLVQLLILRVEVEYTKLTSRIRKTGVLLPGISATTDVIVTILIHFSKHI